MKTTFEIKTSECLIFLIMRKKHGKKFLANGILSKVHIFENVLCKLSLNSHSTKYIHKTVLYKRNRPGYNKNITKQKKFVIAQENISYI